MTSSTIPTTDITSPVLKKDKASKLSKHESKVDTLRSSSKVEERKKKPKVCIVFYKPTYPNFCQAGHL